MEESESDQSQEVRSYLPKFSFLNNLDVTPDVKRKLSSHLENLRKGSDEVYLTPLGKFNDPISLLNELDDLFAKNSHKIDQGLKVIEESNKSKFGPRSIAIPWRMRSDSLRDYYVNCNNDRVPEFSSVKGTLRPISPDNAIHYLKNNTNSGLPYYTRKGLVKTKALEDLNDLLSKDYPCVLFTRTQEGNKTRNVWGYPIADTLNEMTYYQPLLKHQMKESYRVALLGPDYVDKHITQLLLKYHSSDKLMLSIDFSSYDSTVSTNLQDCCFKYISGLFNGHANGLEYISHRFKTIPILTPDGIITGQHGVPSGATFTNEVDSICQFIISSKFINPSCINIQGDDGLYFCNEADKDNLIHEFESYGLKVNRDKTGFGNSGTYLQRYYSLSNLKDGLVGGIYSIYRALNRLVYQERYSDFESYDINGKDYYSIRAICILENCKYHPLFNEFVKLILSKDKYLLSYSESGLNRYKEMLYKGSGTIGVLNNQYGDYIKGINNFTVSKLIKEYTSSNREIGRAHV